MFGPSGFWTMALLRYAAKYDPFLSLDCARVEGLGAQGRDKIPSGNTVQIYFRSFDVRISVYT